MSESDALPIITVRIGDRQRRLSTAKQWRLAIVNHDLTRDTPIQHELGGRRNELVAGQCAELMPVFDELLGPLAVEPPPQVNPPPAAPEGLVPDEVELEAETEEDEFEVEDSEELQPVDPESEIERPKPSVGFWTPQKVAVGVGAALFLYWWGGGEAERPTATSTPVAQSSSVAPLPAVQSIRFFARRNLPILAGPMAGGAVLGTLSRGDEVQGVFEGTGSWVRLTSGTGGYVPSDALQESAPPALDRSTAEEYFALESAPIFSAPSDGSTEVGTLRAGSKIRIAGTVNGEFAEFVRHDKSIGYVRWNVFGGVGGKGRRAWLEISNRCSTVKNLALSLVIDGQRLNGNTFWSFAPGKTDSINFEGEVRIEVDSVDLYYRDLGDTFDIDPEGRLVGQGIDQVYVKGELKEMKRLVPVATEDGAYRVTFC